jgi:glycosyltransferase involved in cell wall biosynthesis
MATKSDFKVVVLLPVMNEAVWLERCLTSLINQTQEGIAILIQENCSDDGSVEIISRFALDFPNIYLFKNSSRVDSWKNWDLLLHNALNHFNFEYLFWIGGDDYLNELDFIQSLYYEGKSANLSVVSPTIIVIDGKNGQRKDSIEFSLSSNVKLFRIIKYCSDWRNVNIFHSLISKDVYQKLFKMSGDSHTSYIGNDWWIVFLIIRKYRITSLKNTHFHKSQWSARRYQWKSDINNEKGNGRMFLRIKGLIEHIFQDAFLLVEHVLRRRSIRNSLTSYEISIILVFYILRAVIRPPLILRKWLSFKCHSLSRKPFPSSPTIN